ncbi:hypothetical protein ABFS83_02G098300 [Erythranthe nasuta]
MAAEDDDDVTFGDFASASFQSKSLADNEDDEWGDFVKSPQQSKPSGTNFNGDRQSDNWVKPSGALPLSIFGDPEEEDKEVHNFGISVDVNQGKKSTIALDLNSNLVSNDASKNNRNLNISDLFNRYLETKPENGHGPISTGSENGVHSNGAGSAVTELKNIDFNDRLGVIDGSQLTNTIDNDEFSFKSYAPDPNQNADPFGGWTHEFSGFSSNSNTSPHVHTSSSDVDMNGQIKHWDGSATVAGIDDDDDEEDGDDDDGWEFKDASSEFRTEEVNNKKVNLMEHEVSESSAHSFGIGSSLNNSLDLFGTSNGSLFAMPDEPVDYFATPSGISGASGEIDFVGIQPSVANLNGFASETNSVIEQNNVKSLLNSNTDVGSAEYDADENFGDFTVASAVAGPKQEEVSTNGFHFPSKDVVSTLDDKIQEKDTNLNYHKGAIPLSIFGNEEPESGDSSDIQDLFMHQSTSDQRNSHTPTSVISINDLISSLYSQTEQTSIVNTVQNPTETQLGLSSAASDSNIEDDEDLDDDSWDFKDASQTIVDSAASNSSIGDTYMSISSKLKLNNYLDFYSKLKEELCFVAQFHIESLKQARADATISGEGEGAASTDSELQLVCKELEEMNILFEDSNLQDHPSGDSHLNQFVQILLEPQFQILDSEYHLSGNLLRVKKDLRSAMELLRHTTTMLKILNVGTTEEQMAYISIWSEIISACTQELKHGASIWNQAVEKHLQTQLLSEPQGRKFFLALGEIYKVVVVLGASAKLFKPWTLSVSVDSPPAIYILLEECHAVWSSSGIEEAFSSALDNSSLLKSIKHILDLDALTLENYLFAEKESRCWLSILTAEAVPDMKMITWGNQQCFVTLANLWANLISRNPPELAQLNLG